MKQSKVMVFDSESYITRKNMNKIMFWKTVFTLFFLKAKKLSLTTACKELWSTISEERNGNSIGYSAAICNHVKQTTGQTKIWFAKLHLHKASWLIRQHYSLQNAWFLQILCNICSKYGVLKCFHAGYAVFSYVETKVSKLRK